MEALVHLDTHVVIWLYAGDLGKLSDTVKAHIEENTLVVSPMVTLELAYLKETNRLQETSQNIINDLRDRIGLTIDTTSLSLVVDQALHMQWTRDPFDRIITAQAASYDHVLLTKDENIRKNYSKAVW